MTEHLFGLRAGASRIKISRGPSFGHGRRYETYQFIGDKEMVEYLKEKTDRQGRHLFRWLSTEEIHTLLESAEDAADTIRAGDVDNKLDLLLFAERDRYGNRVTVVDAIAERDREIEAEQMQSDRGRAEADLSPGDVRPGPA